MAPFDGQDFKAFVAPAITPSRETEARPPASLPIDPVLEVLVKARALIEVPELWCRNALTKTLPDGRIAHCALGAFYKDRSIAGGATVLLNALEPKWHFNVAEFNNDPATTHADVLSLFDRAIADRRAILSAEGV